MVRRFVIWRREWSFTPRSYHLPDPMRPNILSIPYRARVAGSRVFAPWSPVMLLLPVLLVMLAGLGIGGCSGSVFWPAPAEMDTSQASAPMPGAADGTGAMTDTADASHGDGLSPLVVISFAEPDPPWQLPLTMAVNLALQRKPAAVFHIEAIHPALDEADIRRAPVGEIVRALTRMGISPARIERRDRVARILDAEIRLYVR